MSCMFSLKKFRKRILTTYQTKKEMKIQKTLKRYVEMTVSVESP